MQLDSDERVDPHTHPEKRIVLFVQRGKVELTLDDRTFTLAENDVVRLDGRHEVSPQAKADSEALVVLAERIE